MAVEAELIGSGTRAISANAFVASITESWMAMKNANLWLETAANISITSTLVQGAEDISSATPDNMSVRFKNFEFSYNNNPEKQVGIGGAGVAQDIDKGTESAEFQFSTNYLNSAAAAELAYYTNQDAVALELDLKGAQIDTSAPAGIPLYYGIHIVIPKCKLRKAPRAEGDDVLTQNWEVEILDDGTNAPVIIEGYNAQAAYLA